MSCFSFNKRIAIIDHFTVVLNNYNQALMYESEVGGDLEMIEMQN